MLQQNLIISLPTYPKFCWYATGTTHIFHLGLNNMQVKSLLCMQYPICGLALLVQNSDT